MRRRWCLTILGSVLIGSSMIGGCQNKQSVSRNVGLLDPAEYAADVHDDHNRLLGEDKAPPPVLDEPLYQTPFTAIGDGFDFIFVQPTTYLYKTFTDDTPARAARDILDERSPDTRRYGILRLTQEAFARAGKSELDLDAEKAKNDNDYTVRAAGIRALNWSRAQGHSAIFIAALHEQEPLVRLEGAKALANLPDPAAIDALIDRLQHDMSQDVRIAAADALRCYHNQEVAQRLIDMLNDREFGVAWQARQSLMLMTEHDFQYDPRLWTNYLATTPKPFV